MKEVPDIQLEEEEEGGGAGTAVTSLIREESACVLPSHSPKGLRCVFFPVGEYSARKAAFSVATSHLFM